MLSYALLQPLAHSFYMPLNTPFDISNDPIYYLAHSDRLSLRAFKYHDLVTLYLEDLLDRHASAVIALQYDTPPSDAHRGGVGNGDTGRGVGGKGSGSGSNGNEATDSALIHIPSSSSSVLPLPLPPTESWAQVAANECRRLLGEDPVLWERWVGLQTTLILINTPRLPLY